MLAILGALAVVAVLGRLYTYWEPLERDLATYAIVGHELRHGRLLYTDLWDHKPPAIHVMFTAADAIAGYGRPAVMALNVTVALLTLPAIYLLGSAAGMGARAGLWAAATWTTLSLNLPLEANQPNVEVFINLCVSWALVPLLRSGAGALPWPLVLTAAVLAGAASLFKQTAVVPIAAVGLTYALGPFWRPRLTRVALVLIAPAVTWLMVSLHFASTGRLEDFYAAVFGYNRTYMAGLGETAMAALQPYPMAFVLAAGLPATLGALAVHRGAAGGSLAPYVMLLAFVVGTAVQVALPGQWHPHYFQLWAPALALALGWGSALLRRLRPAWRPDLVAAAVLAPLVAVTIAQFTLHPREWSLRKYGPDFVATEAAAQHARTLLMPGEALYHLGSHPGLYLETGQRPPAGMFYLPIPRQRHPLYALEGGPLVGSRAAKTVQQLEAAQPDLLVLSFHTLRALAAHPHLQEHPVVRWCAERYVPLPARPANGFFTFYARADSPLALRSGATGGPRSNGLAASGARP